MSELSYLSTGTGEGWEQDQINIIKICLTARQKTSVMWFSVRKKAAASSTLENPSTPPSTDGPNTGYVTGPGNQATGEHFNSKGHSLADMEFFILEAFKNGDHHLRKEREKYYINKFNTKHKGMNNKK